MAAEHTAGAPREAGQGIDPWTLFETRLGAYMSTMIDPRDRDRLVLHIPFVACDTGWAEIAIRTIEAGEALMVDYSFDNAGDTIDNAGAMAVLIGDTIRSRYQTPHPELMSSTAVGPAAGGVAILGLVDHEALHAVHAMQAAQSDSEGMTLQLAYAEGREELVQRLLTHLRAGYDVSLELDDVGDIFLVAQGGIAWVRVKSDEPIIEVFHHVVRGVRSRRQADTELNILNRERRWSRWVREDHVVTQRALIPSLPFNPAMVDEILGAFLRDHLEVSCDLADRLGGQVAP